MKKLIISLLLGMIFQHSLKSSVDFGGTWVAPVPIYPACHGQEYVNLGFHVNWEIGNTSFDIQKSTDPNFSWSIIIHTIPGCGTCAYSMHSFNDYSAFVPGQVWHYRVRAMGLGPTQFKYLGSYTCNLPTIVNWVSQVTNQFITGASPSTESSYNWFQESRDMQGVNISLVPTEISNIYLEQNNNRINFISGASNPITSLEVNINNGGFTSIFNGSGVNSYTWAGSISAFPNLTTYNLKVKYSTVNSTVFFREYNISVVPKSDGFYLDNYCNTIRVWKGNDPVHGTPLILSEGFDAYSTKSQQYYRESGKDLINCLLNKGFNVYIVDYYLNSQSILNNAAVFQSAIRYVSSLNNNKKVVATGMSMGGVINRYACAQAEANSNPLPISKFVSIDAPQQGAVLSSSLQNWRKSLTTDPFEIAASDNDAAKQLLLYNAYDVSGVVRNLFSNVLNSINGDGYPHLVEKIGISFSNNSPNPNSGNWISITPSAVQSATQFAMTNSEMLAGSYLPTITMDPLQFYVPLIRISVNITQLKDPCFIPHASALDIVNGVSKFNKVIFPSVTGFHDKIPPSIVEEVVNVLLEDNIYIQNKTISSSRSISSRFKIEAGQNVNAQQPTGIVNVNSNNNVVFKAGLEIALREGFQSIPGSEFTAIIGPVQCDNSFEYQNRIIPSGNQIPNPSAYNNVSLPDLNSDNPVNIENFYSQATDGSSNNKNPKILPNPTEGLVFISSIETKELRFEIFGLDSKMLTSGVCTNQIISFENLNKGVYLLKLFDRNDKIYTFKVIRN